MMYGKICYIFFLSRRSENISGPHERQLDIRQQQMINQMIVDEISLGMMDPSSYEQSNPENNAMLGIERVYGLNLICFRKIHGNCNRF